MARIHPNPPSSATARARRLAALDALFVTLPAGINGATARFLIRLEEFDRWGGWQEPGLVSCAHCLNWRCGIGLNAARETLRVARAVPGRPEIRRHFEPRGLGFSRVRALTGIATSDNKHVQLGVARRQAAERHAARSLSWHHDENGRLVIHAVLPPEEAAIVLDALRTAMDEAANVDPDQRFGHAQQRYWPLMRRWSEVSFPGCTKPEALIQRAVRTDFWAKSGNRQCATA